jgi:hypothetical protein
MGKYDEYVISGPRPWHPAGTGPQVAWWNSKDNDGKYAGSHQYHVHWVGKTPENMARADSWGDTGHGPHTHKYPEVLMHLGTDPDSPLDLGAEVEFYLGPEMEKHTLTTSCAVYLPAEFVHGPWIIRRVDRPFIVVTVEQSEDHAEKSRPELVPEEDRKKYMYIDQNYDSEERVVTLAEKMEKEWG